jgi:hypothetical protein
LFCRLFSITRWISARTSWMHYQTRLIT